MKFKNTTDIRMTITLTVGDLEPGETFLGMEYNQSDETAHFLVDTDIGEVSREVDGTLCVSAVLEDEPKLCLVK